jgi:hypothetical protein
MGSISQPPPGGAQATREPLRVKALLPIAACTVSAWAPRGQTKIAISSPAPPNARPMV